jgi:hypothetical protein
MRPRDEENPSRYIPRSLYLAPPIPAEDCINIFYHIEGNPREETDAEIERRRAQLLEKYGRRILSQVSFVVIGIASSKDEEVSDDL